MHVVNATSGIQVCPISDPGHNPAQLKLSQEYNPRGKPFSDAKAFGHR